MPVKRAPLNRERVLKSALARIDSLAAENTELGGKLGAVQQMVASLQGMVEQQKSDLRMISDTVTSTGVPNTVVVLMNVSTPSSLVSCNGTNTRSSA